MTNAPTTTVSPDDTFLFYTRHANPELWRTTVPLIVRRHCNGHKGLIATWTAIHWLMVLWSAEGRTDFGVRDIAREAGVGRNELTGPNGYIQRLIGLDLLQIVGQRRIPGLREPRPVYAIDLRDLEARSAQLVPEVLREAGVRPPPKPAPPNQLPLFPDMPDAPAAEPAMPENGAIVTARPETLPATHPTGTAPEQDRTVMHGTGTAMPENEPVLLGNGPETPDSVPAMPTSVPVDARIRDVERGKERKRERESDILTHADLPLLVQTITTTVIAELTNVLPEQTKDLPPPAAPADAPSLPAPPLALWRADRADVSQRDLFHLELLANQYDEPTEGFGAYWLGRAIMMADLCLEAKTQRATIPYLKAVLRRWHANGTWGSDLDVAPAEANLPIPAGSVPSAPDHEHPAVCLYIQTVARQPNTVQAAAIATTISDTRTWEGILREWQAHGWKVENVAGMLDRYRTATGQRPPPEERVSDLEIFMAPVDSESRGIWMARFRAADSPTAQRAVLERFRAAFPEETAGGANNGT